MMDQKDALNEQEPVKRVSKQRSDGQKSGLAGEFFVAAELLKRGLQTSLTLGNAKSIDLFAINDKGTSFTIQVKALRSPGSVLFLCCWLRDNFQAVISPCYDLTHGERPKRVCPVCFRSGYSEA
jgi:hypothetical protein